MRGKYARKAKAKALPSAFRSDRAVAITSIVYPGKGNANGYYWRPCRMRCWQVTMDHLAQAGI